MKRTIVALAAVAAVAALLPTPMAEAGNPRRPGGVATGNAIPLDALFAPQPAAKAGAIVRRQRAAPAKSSDNNAKRGEVAASAQVVRTPPVAQTTAGSKVAANGRAPSSLDCRRYIPTASMTISVPCAD
jgi:hypothetical protein